MSDLRQRLEKILAPLGESAEFLAHGTLPPALPGLEVAGAGSIGLPISDADARQLISIAEQAPYGRGSETIVDTNVRRVWQIEPSHFALRNPGWDAQVEAIVTAVGQRFAISGKVRHELYKLLIYETGSFFTPHRDTEKTPGMFATLVVCLPSRHEGGTLIVEHEGRSERVDFGGPESEFRMGYAAFYADCRHEITPVRAGYRVCLIYNLALDQVHEQPAAPRSSQTVTAAAALLRELFADESVDRNKVVIPLEHQYTEAGLDPTALKGADRARVEVLSRAAASLEYECSLALVTHYQTGSVDPESWVPPYYRSRRSRRGYYREDWEEEADPEDDAGVEMEEVCDETITLDHWRDMTGQERPFGALHVEDDELLCGEEREGWTVRQEIHEATGNAGAELQRWYHQCALVIWPRDRFFHILAAEGQAAALPELERMAAEAADPEALSACRVFAAAIFNHWSRSLNPSEKETWPRRMLAVLEQIGTADLAGQFVREVLAHDFNGREGTALCRLMEKFGWEALRPALTAFFRQQQPARGEVAPTRLFSVLAPLYAEPETWTPERRAVCISLAHELADAAERWSPGAERSYWLMQGTQTGLVANGVRVFALGAAPEPLDRLLDRALRGEWGCTLHEVLIPDVKAIAGWVAEVPDARPAYLRLREHCREQLRAATAHPVVAPSDWRREAELSCNCADCQALARFLADPGMAVARFPMAERRRAHLHAQIEHRQCDCTHETERKGRPYTLVCQKTSASYERREKQYQVDSKLLQQIEKLPAG